ncbi:MAG: hypothetical protein QNL24_16185, partial [Akkermansiaceae bacterium]
MSDRFSSLFAPLLASILLTSFSAPAADLNLVGSEMVRMLQNGHYGRLAYDEKLGSRFLNEYLEGVDPQKVYFTQEEIDDLNEK